MTRLYLFVAITNSNISDPFPVQGFTQGNISGMTSVTGGIENIETSAGPASCPIT
jgi:hypothetical protein